MACSKKKVFKTGIVVCLLAGMLAVTSCSAQSQEKDVTYVSLTKDGNIKSHISESFEQSYYDREELQQKILSSVATYNRTVGAGNISVDKVKVEGGRVVVEMTYQEAVDYAAFNEIDFFAGSPQEAQEAGYQLNVVLSSVKDSLETIGQADILALGNARLLIADIEDPIRLSGKALYIGEGVRVSDNGKAVCREEGNNGRIYVVYQ